uniref:Uncharacterized protein n=1 Tax=Timema genevievae TaxID=629358 RepID=A0A7R9K988_TIMGE|nr:unnamed protein product [Timema genevievae]
MFYSSSFASLFIDAVSIVVDSTCFDGCVVYDVTLVLDLTADDGEIFVRIPVECSGVVTRRDRIRDEDVRSRVEIVEEARMRWFGHFMRMEGERIPRRLMDMKYVAKRPQERRRKRWEEQIASSESLSCLNTRCVEASYPGRTVEQDVLGKAIKRCGSVYISSHSRQQLVKRSFWKMVCWFNIAEVLHSKLDYSLKLLPVKINRLLVDVGIDLTWEWFWLPRFNVIQFAQVGVVLAATLQCDSVRLGGSAAAIQYRSLKENSRADPRVTK